jgi:hypothetical protein
VPSTPDSDPSCSSSKFLLPLVRLVDAGEDGLGDLLEDDELGHGVGDPVDGRVSGNEEGIGAFYSGFGPILFKQ